MQTQHDTSRGNAQDYARRFGRLLPLCWPVNGKCGCGRGHQGRDIGKAPLTEHGWHNASSRPREINYWAEQFPGCNWGLVIADGYIAVDPDSPEALAEAQQLGLSPTVVRKSRNDAYLYQRPDECPATNKTRKGASGKLDILATGYLVVLGTHQDGTAIELIGEKVVSAPNWAVVQLTAKPPVSVTPPQEGEPPVRLQGDALRRWHGEFLPEDDRSQALFLIGRDLARAGATASTITASLEERDWTLGFDKYTPRGDRREYSRIAAKVLSDHATHQNGYRPEGSTATLAALPSAAEHAFEAAAPELPEDVWEVSIFGEFREWLSPCVESPDSFIFGSALAFTTLAVGRDVFHYAGRRHCVNNYVLLVGSTAVRKGLPIANIRDEIVKPGLIDLSQWTRALILHDFGSAEGLVEAFGEWMESGAGRNKRRSFEPISERRILNIEEEFGNLLTKMRRRGTENLRDRLCQLWDGINIEPLTRRDRVRAERPFYSLLAMTTPERLQDGLTDLDFTSGLLPRFQVYLGLPKPPIPEPPMPEAAYAEYLAERLKSISEDARELGRVNLGKLALSPDANEHWGLAYIRMRERASSSDSDKEGAMRARLEVHVLKTALLFAVCEGHTRIEIDDLQRALSLGEYLAATADMLADMKFGADLKRLEDRMLRVLKSRPGEYLSVSALHQKLGGRTNAADVHKLVRSMTAIGLVQAPPDSPPDRPKAIMWPG